ncbi:hypothetical protein SH601_05255 [Gracilibacillus sp. S3-1-1]|uniref:Uncharacterized protein n=1 Tax=Gracilibacillus pellucidus TaxID=3095368 RepID=A0ACC6M3C1_9BACI|nr:hypothetical protein [Gracilibacillus sp. S3-1-1]MDX8045391.1 hypothetical protein [Gracilibacillus sp. S3-1-1]
MNVVEKNYVLPITTYLNQKIVFDLLAVIEDGFAQVTNLNISTSKSITTTGSADGETGFGLYGVKTKIKAAFGKEKNNKDEKSANEERVHTPTSLFSKLVTYLDENELIRDISCGENLQQLDTGSFVRFKSRLEKNPLVSMLDSLEQIGVMAMSFQGNKNGGKKNNDQEVLKQIKTMRNNLVYNGILDIICTINETEKLKAVIPVYMDYFVRNNMNEIIDGNYTVIGKVVKVVRSPEDNINLFRNTGFKLFKQQTLENLFLSMNKNVDEQLDFPEIRTKVLNPSMLVIPMAIYS